MKKTNKNSKANKTFEEMNKEEKRDLLDQLWAKLLVKITDDKVIEKVMMDNEKYFNNYTEKGAIKFYKDLITALN